MKLLQVIKAIKRVIGTEKPVTNEQPSQTYTAVMAPTITAPSNTESEKKMSETLTSPEKKQEQVQTQPKRPQTVKRSNGSVSKRKRMYANVKSEELDSEIIRAEKRLYYLRARRKKSGTDTPLRRKPEDVKERNADYVYYKYWVKDRNFTQKYSQLREDMVVSAKHFVAYHNRIMKVVNMFGNEQEKAALKAVLGNNQEELKM